MFIDYHYYFLWLYDVLGTWDLVSYRPPIFFCFASVLFIPYIVMSYRPPIYFIFCLYCNYAVSCYVILASVYSYFLFFLLSIFTVCCHLISALFVLCPVQYLYHVLCHIGLHFFLVLPVHDLYHVIKFQSCTFSIVLHVAFIFK